MAKKPTYEELEQKVKELQRSATFRKQMEEILKESEERFRLLYERAPIGYQSLDKNGHFIEVNQAWLDTLGYEREEVIGKSFGDFLSPERSDHFKEYFLRYKAVGEILGVEFEMIKKNGSKMLVSFNGKIGKDNKGNFKQTHCILHDITERKQAEEKLQESEERFRNLIQGSIQGILIHRNHKPLFVNQKWADIHGYSVEEVLKMETVVPLISLEDQKRMIEYKEARLQGKDAPTDYEYQGIQKNGSLIWLDNRVRIVRWGKHQAIQTTVFDITERKWAEEALQKSEKNYRLLVKNLPGVVYKGYKDWSVEFIDKKFELLTGYDVDEFNSKRMLWSDIIVKEDIEAAKDSFIKALKSDKAYVREYRIHSKAGDDVWIQERGQIICSDRGEIEYVNGVFFDITERKRLETQLQQAQKLEAIGILAGGLAHDFNNLLAIIMGNIELVKDNIKPEVEISENLKEAEKASHRAKELIKQLITFSKEGEPVKEVGSIGDLVKDTVNLTISGSNTTCEFSLPEDLWLSEFNEGQMKHAIKNLIDNAIESMPDGGSINVQAENFEIDSETAELGLPLSEGKYIKISIRDLGVGIPEEYLFKIFDPYFSTKKMGVQKGMGISLATTYSIIKRHNGHITVESEVGVGSTFTLYLPPYEKDIREFKPVETPKPEKPAI